MSWRLLSRVAMFLVASHIPLRAQSGPVPEEYRLKAAILFRLPEFVTWPAAALDGRDVAQICVATPNPFGDALQQATSGETLMGRRIGVREVGVNDDILGCQVLFLSSLRGNDTKLLSRAATLPILTVGETTRFLDEGGIIRLHLVDRKVRFDIDARAASRAGLSVSSQLMRLASDVRGQR